MSISMIGIDYKKASVDVRAQFSFTKKNTVAALENLKKEPGILGCIILSTCNRMEIWVSTGEDWKGSLYEFLCKEKEKDPREFEQYFVKREEEEAVEHLFYLTSGLKSQILAEDQIITQVKDALALSREAYCTDNVLEVLFRMAVTAAKKVKTQVSFSRANSSVIHQAIERLEDQGFSIQGKTCMVIGNGEMGKVTALALKEAGADVTVTVRHASLLTAGMDPNMPAAVLQQGTTAGQKRIVSTVEKLPEEVKRQGVETPAIIIVGRVCALADAFAGMKSFLWQP